MIEKTFVDRVPTHPGRVTLTPVPGQANVYDMVRSDSPTEPGTPLNKATFDSMTQSRLTGRYYRPTSTRVQRSSVTSTVNPIPTSGWSNDFILSANGGYSATVNASGGNYPSYAFDGDDGSYWAGADGLTEHWLRLELPEAITVTRVRVKMQDESSANPPTVYVEGSNNGSSWTELLTYSATQAFVAEYNLTNTGDYKYYRLRVTYKAVNKPRVYTFGFASYSVKTYDNQFLIAEGMPSEWSEGQRVMVQIPTTANAFGVTANTLNGVAVNTILQPGKRYELRYTGSAFAAKEV